MTLDRWLSLLFLGLCLAYGYSAFFVLDASLPPFARMSPIWPSSFPKILAVAGVFLGAGQFIFWSKPTEGDFSNYEWRTTVLIVVAMIAYALFLRPVGFVGATVLFLTFSAWILGERNFKKLVPISLIGALFIWYLVDQVLGIFLRPWPFLIYGGL